jgi:hypothetical protein
MGPPLTKEEIIDIANKLIKVTVPSKTLSEFKEKQHLGYDTVAGDGCYRGFHTCDNQNARSNTKTN